MNSTPLSLLGTAILLIGNVGVAVAGKPELFSSIESRSEQSWQIASQIWQWAEPGYQETRSAKLLSDTRACTSC